MKKRDKYIDFLIFQSQNGRKNPYLELVELYQQQVFLLSLKLSGNIKHAEKITNEVYVQAWEHIKLINKDTPFELWLHGLAISVSLADYREFKKNNKKHSEYSEILCSTEFDNYFLSLNQVTRNILILRDLEGYAIDDIAVALDEKDILFIKEHLDLGRQTLAETETYKLLNTFSEMEWNNLTSDFDAWAIQAELLEGFTEKFKILNNYRATLSKLFSSNSPSSSLLDPLKEKLFDTGKVFAHNKQKGKLKSVAPKEIIKRRVTQKRNRLINEIAMNFVNKHSKKDFFETPIKNKKQTDYFIKFVLIGVIIVVIFVVIMFFY